MRRQDLDPFIIWFFCPFWSINLSFVVRFLLLQKLITSDDLNDS